MTKSQLIAMVAEKTDITKKCSEEVVDCVFQTIIEALKNNDKVVINGFGTFEIHTRSQRVGRNPQTGEEMLIEGSVAPVFKAAKIFKQVVNE